jgi:hypothetical protein
VISSQTATTSRLCASDQRVMEEIMGCILPSSGRAVVVPRAAPALLRRAAAAVRGYALWSTPRCAGQTTTRRRIGVIVLV